MSPLLCWILPGTWVGPDFSSFKTDDLPLSLGLRETLDNEIPVVTVVFHCLAENIYRAEKTDGH